VPYDEALAERVRRALAGIRGVTEKKMFGGIAFLVDGAMCIGVDRNELIVRCAKDETEALLAKDGVRAFDLSGERPMKGWLLVGPAATGTAAGFEEWLDFARGQMLHFDSTPVRNHIAPNTDIAIAAQRGNARYHPAPARPAPTTNRWTRSRVPTFLSNVSVTSFFASITTPPWWARSTAHAREDGRRDCHAVGLQSLKDCHAIGDNEA